MLPVQRETEEIAEHKEWHRKPGGPRRRERCRQHRASKHPGDRHRSLREPREEHRDSDTHDENGRPGLGHRLLPQPKLT